ncbi:hypothetical protein L226DRAFT_574412 [Lentinus tigrinus ALCF2SS1-7]|uniref:uncharacterized protein n=1 Tax=Lentinus tigrinus ALCF2SS1-7 TaxID=1328758 RepID=UPI001165D88D|nr:hypothetical protein L226DRAFT_574412 [Lentinus tigrinus ALCF2SS1-7]
MSLNPNSKITVAGVVPSASKVNSSRALSAFLTGATNRVKDIWLWVESGLFGADPIVYHGALVPLDVSYGKLRFANVLGTLTAVELAPIGKPKLFTFVEYYYNVRLSEA